MIAFMNNKKYIQRKFKMKRKHIKYLLPIIVFITLSLFIHTVLLHKSIMDIDWIFYLIVFVVSLITGYICDIFKK